MGFRLAVSGGAENINLDEKTIQKVTFSSDSATDSNAKYRFWHCGKDYRKNVV